MRRRRRKKEKKKKEERKKEITTEIEDHQPIIPHLLFLLFPAPAGIRH